MNCKECEQPLAEIDFHGNCVAYCENWECPLHRQHEVTKVKVKETKKRPSRKLSPFYKRWLKQRRPKRRERYQAIRSLGIGFRKAVLWRDKTSMTIEDIKELTE